MYLAQDLRPGDVLLMTSSRRESLPARLLDALISASEGSPFVHTCLVGDGHLVDPVWRVEQAPLDRYADNGWPYRVRASPEQAAAAIAWAESHVGNPYGLAELLADGARFDLHLVLPSWYLWRPQRWTCSGFVTAAFAQAALQLTRAPCPSPADLSWSPLLIGRRPWETAGGVAT